MQAPGTHSPKLASDCTAGPEALRRFMSTNSMSVKGKFMRFWLSSLTLLITATALAAAGPGYKVVNTYKVGGDGGWDYLTADASARRLYISRATHVIVLDLDSGKTVGDIADTPGVHGIALAPELGP